MKERQALIITGMDRSGTSWLSGGLQASGVFLGNRFCPANRGNPFGYFEDEAFIDLHVKMLQAVNLEGLAPYRSLTELPAQIPVSTEHRRLAEKLIQQRREYSRWGFKNPRAVLFLEFWRELIPEAKIICLYRHPMETCLSFFNRGDILGEVEAVFRAFEHRMGQAMAFYEKFPEQMLLCNVHRVIAAPERLEALLDIRLGISQPGLSKKLTQNFVPAAFSTVDWSKETKRQFYQLFPRAAYLFKNLEQAADMPQGPFQRSVTEPAAPYLPVPEKQIWQFLANLLADSLTVPHNRAKIVDRMLSQMRSDRTAQTDLWQARREKQQLDAQLTALKHQFQSQDLLTRRWVKVTFNNLADVWRRPSQLQQKAKRWVAHRFKKVEAKPSPPEKINPPSLSPAREEWLAQMRAEMPVAIAVLHPDWLGIRSSTCNLFSSYLFVDDTSDAAEGQQLARLLIQTGCHRIVFSGFAQNYAFIIESLRRQNQAIKIFVLWHGNLLQSGEDYNWQAFGRVKKLAQQGYIDNWGFVKEGMAEEVAALGYKTGFVMNYVGTIPSASAPVRPGGPHLGVWGHSGVWRKNPYAMLTACTLIPGSTGYLHNAQPRDYEFVETMGLNIGLLPEPVPPTEMNKTLQQFDLNLYVTLSECAPMLPLESLAAGVPCLIGPTSHLFKDNSYLQQMLVVPQPDSPTAIADYAQRALENRDEIVRAYIDYAPGYNARAKASLNNFLEL